MCQFTVSMVVASSPPPPQTPPLSLTGVTALIFIYIVICYLIIDLIDRTEDISIDIPSRSEEDVSPGLSLEQLQSIPCFDYGIGKTTTCAVCLDGLENGEKYRMFPVCKHVFHVSCIDLWLMRRLTCPTCRSPFQIGVSLDVV